MSDATAAFAVLAGLAFRLLIPILITAIVVIALTRLDRHWASEASAAPSNVVKPDCWKTRQCSESKRQDCLGYKSALPCWQAFRHNDGYLDEKCLGCPVLIKAPIPFHA